MAPTRAGLWRAEERARALEAELTELRGELCRQVLAREALHKAVAERDVAGVRTALKSQAAQPLLLPIEIRWAAAQLDVLAMEESQRRAQERAAEERRRQEEEQKRLQEERQKEAAEAASKEVEDAVRAGDVDKLHSVLDRARHVLPYATIDQAVRRIPMMKLQTMARTSLDSAVKVASSTGKMDDLRYVVKWMQTAALPKEEKAAAQQVLKETEAQLAAEALAQQEAAAREQEKAAPPAPQAPAPQTPLERAVCSGDAEQIRAAISELRKQGIPSRDIARLRAEAAARFGAAAPS